MQSPNKSLQLTAQSADALWVPSALRAPAATELGRWAARENVGTYTKRKRFFLEAVVPEVSRFYGIIIALYYNDHAPAHFHAKYGGDEATILIETGQILDGSLSKRAQRLVEEWRTLRKSELEQDWALARARHPLNKIEPLE